MPRIYSWCCSLYHNSNRRWLHGNIHLYEDGLSFREEHQKNDELFQLSIPYSSILSIRNATSKIIFSCIVFKVAGEEVWISSLDNRDMVFTCINHFWKEGALFGGGTATSNKPLNRNQELVQIAHDTQSSLMGASRMLHSQGQQLSNAGNKMNQIHNDITVAERLTDDIDSWFGAWRIKGNMKKKDDISQTYKSALHLEKVEYSALIAKSVNEIHQDGYIIMKNNCIDFVNKKSEIIQTFVISEISEFNVHTPFDMTFRKRKIGQPDTMMHVISKNLPLLLKTLEKVYKCDLDYEEPPSETEYDATDDILQKRNELFGTTAAVSSKERNNKSLGVNTNQQRTLQTQDSLCEESAVEVMSVLKNIKTIALDVGNELDSQNEQIDGLNASVDRAKDRLKSADWKVKKMT